MYSICNLKTTELLDCALVGICAVIRWNTYILLYKIALDVEGLQTFFPHFPMKRYVVGTHTTHNVLVEK